MSTMKQNRTIDSIAIVIPSYNSSKTILETLKSLESLNKPEMIEIVISDDASTDNTLQLIENWITKNHEYFKDIKLIKNQVNGGISKNHHIAFESVSSEYAVYIGADDLITNKDLICHLVEKLKTKDYAIAKLRVDALLRPSGKILDMYKPILSFFGLNSRRQFSALSVYGNFLYAGPGTLLNIGILRKINGFDVRFRTFEDFPLLLKFLINGYKIDLLDIKGIAWVRSEHSLSANGFGALKDQFTSNLQILDTDYIEKHKKILTWPARILYRIKGTNIVFRLLRKINRAIYGFPI